MGDFVDFLVEGVDYVFIQGISDMVYFWVDLFIDLLQDYRECIFEDWVKVGGNLVVIVVVEMVGELVDFLVIVIKLVWVYLGVRCGFQEVVDLGCVQVVRFLVLVVFQDEVIRQFEEIFRIVWEDLVNEVWVVVRQICEFF